MKGFETTKFTWANFLYITNNMWKHAPRTKEAKNNLIFVTEGTLYIELCGQKYKVKQNEFLLLPYGCESIGYRPSEVHTGFYFVMFDAPPSFEMPIYFTLSNVSVIKEMYNILVRNFAQQNYSHKALDDLLHCLLYEIQYQLEQPMSSEPDSLAGKIKYYIFDSKDRNITLSDIANHFGLSIDHAIRVFYQSEHITLKAYINEQRVKRIEELLISTNTSLSIIAKQLDFPTTSALSKFYKYHTGRTITQYKKKFIN